MELIKIPLLLKSLEQKAGCKVLLEPKYKIAGRILFDDGRNFYFRNTILDINNFGAALTAKDKGYARFFMEELGYRIPEGKIFFSNHWCNINNSKNNIGAGIKFGITLGFPLIVKPNDKSQGEDVFKIYTEKQLKKVMTALFKKHNILLVEKFVSGNDYRVVILDDEMAVAYRRLPFAVLGNGRDSIVQLFKTKIKKLAKQGRNLSLDINDARIKNRLKYFYKFGLSFVPNGGQKIILLDNANLSTGGEAVDVTQTINRSYIKKAVDLVKFMGLRFAGVDFITDNDITKPVDQCVFIELNASPGLSHYAAQSAGSLARVENLYLKILNKLKNMVLS